MEIILEGCCLRGKRPYLHSPDIVSACLSSKMLEYIYDQSCVKNQVIFTFLKPSSSVLILTNKYKVGSTVKIEIFRGSETQSYYLYPSSIKLDVSLEEAVEPSVTFESQSYHFQSHDDLGKTLNLAIHFGRQWYHQNGVTSHIWARQICIYPTIITSAQQIRGSLLRSKNSLNRWIYTGKEGEQLFSILAVIK
jgi:hypothetical protein